MRDALQQAHGFLEAVMQDVTAEQAHWLPAGKALPVGAQYAHILIGEDGFVSGVLRGAAPLFASTWTGRLGVSELPPPPAPGQPGMPPWDRWARSVRVDFAMLRQYGEAVYVASDEYLASLTDSDLTRVIDLSFAGLGQQTLAWALAAGVVGHTWSHLGEISSLKGLQGARGYPV